MCRSLPVPFAGSVTVNANRAPSGENCNSETDRKFNEASGVSIFAALPEACPIAGAEKPDVKATAIVHRKNFISIEESLPIFIRLLGYAVMYTHCSGRGLS